MVGSVRAWAVAASLSVAAAMLVSSPGSAAPGPGSHDVVGLVVTREPGTSAARAQRLVAAQVGEVEGRVPVAPGVTAVRVDGLTLPEAVEAMRALRDEQEVADVGIDTRVVPDALPNDPRFGDQCPGSPHIPNWTPTCSPATT